LRSGVQCKMKRVKLYGIRTDHTYFPNAMKMADFWARALMMESKSTSETSVNFYKTSRSSNSEDSHLHTCSRENLKSRFRCFHFQVLISLNFNIIYLKYGPRCIFIKHSALQTRIRTHITTTNFIFQTALEYQHAKVRPRSKNPQFASRLTKAVKLVYSVQLF
jgi:hypothetical protein